MPDESIWDQSKGPKPRPGQQESIAITDEEFSTPVDEPVDEASIPAELMGGEETPPEPPSFKTFDTADGKVSLPPDIEAVWGEGKVDAAGLPTADFARQMIAAWGLEQFRTSAIHTNAIKLQEREAKMEPIRAAFIKAKKEKG